MHELLQQKVLLPPTYPVDSRPCQLSTLRNPCRGTTPSGPGLLLVPWVPGNSGKRTDWKEQAAPESYNRCLAFGKGRAARASSSEGGGPAHASSVSLSHCFTKPSAPSRLTLAERRESYLFCYRKTCHLLQGLRGHIQDHRFHHTPPFTLQPSSLTHPFQNIQDYIWVKLWYPRATQNTSSSWKQVRRQQTVVWKYMVVTKSHPRPSAVVALIRSFTAKEQHWENKQQYRFQQTQLLVRVVILKAHTEKFSLFQLLILFYSNKTHGH